MRDERNTMSSLGYKIIYSDEEGFIRRGGFITTTRYL
jgi:hypothetical protein